MKKYIYTTKTSLVGTTSASVASQLERTLTPLTDQQVIEAIENLPPQASAAEKNGKLEKLIFTGESAERIERLLQHPSITIGNLIAALTTLIQSDTVNANTSTSAAMTTWLSHSNRIPREGQETFYSNILTALTQDKIGICEASTGFGKTTAIIAALADAIKGRGKRGLIATPAIALVRDFAIEHTRLGPTAPPLRIFLGMGEFVSKSELLEFLANWNGFDQQSADIKKWLDNGAPSLETGIKHAYLKHSLRLISPDIPLEDVLLQDTIEDIDEGMQAYSRQFNKDQDSPDTEEILLCSHAMVAVDLRARLAIASRSEALAENKSDLDSAWKQVMEHKQPKVKNKGGTPPPPNPEMVKALTQVKLAQEQWDKTVIETSATKSRLPDYAYIVVDEAHLLEQSFSNALSNYVAIHQFVVHAKNLADQGLFAKSVLPDINKAYYSLCDSARKQSSDTIHISHQNTDIISPLAMLENAAKQGIGKISKKRMATLSQENLQQLKRFKNNTAWIAQATNTYAGQISYLNLSPRLAYPQLFVGRSSVDQYLRFLWTLAKGATCVSATLYIPKEDGISSWYIQSMLAIPHNRKQDFEPVIPTWIRDTVKEIHIPTCVKKDGRLILSPASKSDKLSEDKKEHSDTLWCQEVAEELVRIYETAAGGCLVLMTSYASIAKVKSFLMENPHIAPNLIYAQQGAVASKGKTKSPPITIDEQRRKYLKLAFDRQKPIWLALGNAWTGINLSGGDPMKELCGAEIPSHEDNVLTDLIVPRLPFGTNKSITHTHRCNHKPNVPWERIDTLLRLRQGTGRLVRRHGVPQNRRIHILDARLCEGILSTMLTPVKKAIGYKK